MKPSTVIAALALLVLVLAVVLGGNPSGRPGAEDKVRMSDLRDLSGFVRCVAELSEKTLPDTLEPFESCGRSVRLADPATSTPYGYEKLGPVRYRVCAAFEKPERLADQWYGVGNFDPATGCATVTLEF